MLAELQKVDLAFGSHPLLEGVDLVVERGTRACIVGRNGSGKSSLLNVIAGSVKPDEGRRRLADGLKIGVLGQAAPVNFAGSALEFTMQGDDADETTCKKLLDRLGVDAEAAYDALSGGLKRRAELARAMSGHPNLLLLDEPTNHLDPDTIEWLEKWLHRPELSVLFVSHDRRFIEAVANGILELDRGVLHAYHTDYPRYLELREKRLEDEARERQRFEKRLSEEEAWIRQGIKARRTRNQGRVRRLKAMREQRREFRQQMALAKGGISNSEASGKIVLEAENVNFGYQGEPLIVDFSLTVLRGDRIGVIGPNGGGKSTLIDLLLGKRQPDSGSIRHGTRLEIAEFDQHRSHLDENLSALDNVSGGRETVQTPNGDRHIIGYMQDFLFTPDQARGPIEKFSGGERARLMLAKLFSKPFNFLVMDEPTNDLDIETLELLEEVLADFDGTVLIVSHDRAFLDNLCTTLLHVEGNGHIEEYSGGYAEYERTRKARAQTEAQAKKQPAPASTGPQKTARSGKLSYKFQRELDMLPDKIEKLEAEIESLHQQMASPTFYQGDSEAIAATTSRLEDLEQQLETALERWETLEELRENPA